MSLSEERAGVAGAGAPRPLIDVAMTASAVAAMVLMLVWFFFFAEMQLAPMAMSWLAVPRTGSPRSATSPSSARG